MSGRSSCERTRCESSRSTVDADHVGLWWGTAEGVGLPELIEVAAATGYGTISLSPSMYFEALARGHTDADLRARLEDSGVVVGVVDPLIRGLPGSPDPAEVGPRFRSTFEHDEADCYRVAEALAAPAVNLAHFLCAADAPGPAGGRDRRHL